MSNREKSRDISIYEYFRVLQYEYIIAELRKKIYRKTKDKRYHAKLMKYKEQKIKDILARNPDLPSIFSNDAKVKLEYYKDIYGTKGLPNFRYPTEEARKEFEESDRYYYYYVGSEVSVQVDDDTFEVGYIEDVDYPLITVKMRNSNKRKKVLAENVTRIL